MAHAHYNFRVRDDVVVLVRVTLFFLSSCGSGRDEVFLLLLLSHTQKLTKKQTNTKHKTRLFLMLDCGLLGWDDVFPSEVIIPTTATNTRMVPASVVVSPTGPPMSLQQQPQKHYYHRTAYSASEISTRPVKHSGVAPRSNNHNHTNNSSSNYYSSMKVVNNNNNNHQHPQQQDPAPGQRQAQNNDGRGFFDAWSNNYPTLTLPRRASNNSTTEVEQRIVVVPPDDYVQLQTDRQLLHQQLQKSTQQIQRLALENQTLKAQIEALQEERKRVQDALEGRE